MSLRLGGWHGECSPGLWIAEFAPDFILSRIPPTITTIQWFRVIDWVQCFSVQGWRFLYVLFAGTEIVKDRKAWHAISPWNRRVRRDLVTEKQPWHLLLLAKSICKWNFNPCTGKHTPDFDGAPVMCPRHRIIHVLSHYTWLHSCGSGRISTVLAMGKFRKHPKVIWLSLCTLRTYCKQGKAFSRCFSRWTYLIFTAVQSRGLYLRK